MEGMLVGRAEGIQEAARQVDEAMERAKVAEKRAEELQAQLARFTRMGTS